MTTTFIRPEIRDELIDILVEQIRNWKLTLEDAFRTEDEEIIELIQARIREEREQLNALQRS